MPCGAPWESRTPTSSGYQSLSLARLPIPPTARGSRLLSSTDTARISVGDITTRPHFSLNAHPVRSSKQASARELAHQDSNLK